MRRLLYLLLGAFATLVVAELLLRALPVATSTKIAYYIHPNILTAPPNHSWTSSTGWALLNAQHMKSNNYGFAADHDFFVGKNAIGLIGDSYVEAAMLPLAERPAAQLEMALGGARPVYAMGGPGSSLLDYAERIKWAHKALELNDFVVMMESTDASQALCSSGNVHARCLKPDSLEVTTQHRPPSSLLKNVLRESALAQYFNSQIKLNAARLVDPDFWSTGAPTESEGGIPVETPIKTQLAAEKIRVIDTAISAFIQELNGVPGLRLIFVIDMNRQNLSSEKKLPDEGSYAAGQLEARGFTVVRGEPLYREHQRRSLRRLDMGPHDGHLNATGVGLLMAAVANAGQEKFVEKKY
jgi:hypothetical protein